MVAHDPLLQPYRLKHLTLKNRIMSTAHEPAYSEDGMPKRPLPALSRREGQGRHRADDDRRLGDRRARTAAGLRQPARLQGRDRALAAASWPTDCHEHGCAVMIQLTHLGRRTDWNKADWLPVLAPSPVREPAHRAFPKVVEDWDIDRVVGRLCRRRRAHARRPGSTASSSRPTAISSTSSGRRPPTSATTSTAARSTTGCASPSGARCRSAQRSAPTSSSASAWSPTRTGTRASTREEGIEIARRLVADPARSTSSTSSAAISTPTRRCARSSRCTACASAPHLDFAGEVRAATKFPVFHAARIADVATARHAIAAGKLDMVGMTRAHIADPHIVRKVDGRPRARDPALRRRHLLPRPHL